MRQLTKQVKKFFAADTNGDGAVRRAELTAR
jgi:hypothetical protein